MPHKAREGRIIIKLSDGKQDYYLEWSTRIQRPITFGMSLDEFKSYYLCEYGAKRFHSLPQRLRDLEQNRGTSSLMHSSLDSFLMNNRAGHGGRTLSKNEIYYWYCIRKEDPVQRAERD